MSQSTRDFEKSLVTGETLESKETYIVQLDASGNLEVAEGATDLLVGVCVAGAPAGAAATYRHTGTAKVILGTGGAAIGDWITSDTAGKGIVTTTNRDVVIGRALEAGDAGDVIEVQLGIFTLSHA